MAENGNWTSIKLSKGKDARISQKQTIDWTKERMSMPCSRTVSIRVSYR